MSGPSGVVSSGDNPVSTLPEQWCVLKGFRHSGWQKPSVTWSASGLRITEYLRLEGTRKDHRVQLPNLTLIGAAGCTRTCRGPFPPDGFMICVFSSESEEHLHAVGTRSCCWSARFTQIKFLEWVNQQ